MSEPDRIPDPSEGPETFHETHPSPSEPSAHTASEIDLDWQGQTDATDFLGLESDLRLGQSPTAAPAHGSSGLAPSSGGPALDSWLMEIESQPGTAGAGTAGAGTASPAANPLHDLDDVLDAAAAGAAETEDDPAGPDEPAAPPAPPRRSRTLVAVGLLALLGVGGWYGWQSYQQHLAPPPAPPEVASRPTTKPTPTTTPPTTTPTDGTTTTSAHDPVDTNPATTPVEATDPALASTDPAGTGLDPDATNPGDDTTESFIDLTSLLTSTNPTPSPSPTTTTLTPLPAPTIDLPRITPPSPAPRGGSMPFDPNTFLPSSTPPTAHVSPGSAATRTNPNTSTTPRGALHVTVDAQGRTVPGSVRRATDADFADLWRQERIPTELYDSDRRIRTLNVGRVRAMIVGGEYFDGTLYAVGQGQIWLDLDLGRISFEASTVREIYRLPPLPKSAVAKKQADELAGLPHVEVRLPGGSITGRLVGQEGNRVTLVTENGMRTIVESDDVRPLTERNTRVVGTLKNLESGQPR